MKIVSINGKLLVDSREVAEKVGKQHSHLLRDIKGYSEILTESNFGLSEFFIESTYQDNTGRTLPCYLLTRKGCDMVANKMTGEKGVLFTATYVTRFEEMERNLSRTSFDLPQTFPEALRLLATEMEQKAIIAADNERLSLETAEQKRKLKEQEAPVAIYNMAISASNTMSMQEVSKSFGTGRTRLYKILREEGLVMKDSTLPYQRYIDAGYFKVVERPRASGDTITTDPATRITAKGFDYIAKLMKKRAEKNGEV